MSPALERRLQTLKARHEELGLLLGEPGLSPERMAALGREYAQLEDFVQTLAELDRLGGERNATAEMLADDPELADMASEELQRLEGEVDQAEQRLLTLLLPRDPRDEHNIFLEIRAGTGGDEAAIFAGDLFRMYSRYADAQRWQVEILSESAGEHGGYREVIARIEGQGAYSRLKFESGTHRVQRVPATEAQGRIHTSACTVAILPELDEVDDIDLNPADLKIDTFRASGAGGQHVNKTDS
ncbi:MAG: PCRF domain-containing protein, partial [Xanthomonadales bacterium]|nr:PCRF domain-containing protein [Xanthomonadales bacterium]